MQHTLYSAIPSDMKDVHGLLLGASANGQLLPRSLSDLYSHTRDFVLLRDDSGVLTGCCALSIVWEDMAEIRSLYVAEKFRGLGLGKQLVSACVENAREMGIHRVFTLTYKTVFFSKMGFAEVGKDILPQKIWADCVHCPKFPDCDEIAMLKVV